MRAKAPFDELMQSPNGRRKKEKAIDDFARQNLRAMLDLLLFLSDEITND